MQHIYRLFTYRMPARAVLALAIFAVFGGFGLSSFWKEYHGARGTQLASMSHAVISEQQLIFATTRYFSPLPSQAPSAEPSPWEPIIERLAADGFDKSYLEGIFTALDSGPLPEFMGQKAVELYGKHGKASLVASERDTLRFAPPDYTRVAGGVTVAAGRRIMADNKKLFEGLYKQYGVPAPFIVGILMVETGIGANLGKQPALLALGSLAATPSLYHVLPVVDGITSNHEAINEKIKTRSEWAYGELKALIRYSQATGKEAWTIPGSVFGAIGICQFMPSNIRILGASAGGKRPVPDVFTFADAAASVARYLSAHGWRSAKTTQAQVAVLRSYNHSDIYASTVYGVANALMTPTTHASAQSARNGKNAVQAAREMAATHVTTRGKAGAINELSDYSALLE